MLTTDFLAHIFLIGNKILILVLILNQIFQGNFILFTKYIVVLVIKSLISFTGTLSPPMMMMVVMIMIMAGNLPQFPFQNSEVTNKYKEWPVETVIPDLAVIKTRSWNMVLICDHNHSRFLKPCFLILNHRVTKRINC